MPSEGDKIGRYRLDSPLGEGGFGSVWVSRDPATGREAAVKVLHEDLINYRIADKGPTIAERFLAEARILKRLEHRGLVAIFDVIDQPDDNIVAYAMERLHGYDLAEGAHDLDMASLLEVFAKVADTVGFLHQNDIVHRDIKAANIFITEKAVGQGHTVKLLDFGVAKELHADAILTNTATGMFMGSVSSMAPESFHRWDSDGPRVSRQIDQWSLGVTLFQCLTGEMPFNDPTMVGLIHKIESEPPDPIRLLKRFGLDKTPEALEALVEQCLRKNSRDRYDDMQSLARVLRRTSQSVCPDHCTVFDSPAETALGLENDGSHNEDRIFTEDEAPPTMLDVAVPFGVGDDGRDDSTKPPGTPRFTASREQTRLCEPAPRSSVVSLETDPDTPLVQFGFDQELLDVETHAAHAVDEPDMARSKVVTGSVNERYRSSAPDLDRGDAGRELDQRTASPPTQSTLDTTTKGLLAVGFFLTLTLGFLIGWLARSP